MMDRDLDAKVGSSSILFLLIESRSTPCVFFRENQESSACDRRRHDEWRDGLLDIDFHYSILDDVLL